MSDTTKNEVKKPIPLRVIFIMNALLMFLPFVFYYVFTTKEITVGDLDPMIMIYTGIGYILSFTAMVFFILKKKMLPFRLVFIAVILMSIPASAFIGIGFAIISLILSMNKQVVAYFSS